MGGLYSRIKTWVDDEDVTYSDLNAEFDNVLTNLVPLMMDDYSTNVTQMQVTADPGEVGTESLATTIAGELARLRFMIEEITGEAQWYVTPGTSLAGLANALGTGLTDNRLVSGLVISGSQQPGFLIANGAARTVKCDGTPTTFVYYVNGTEYSITTDVTLTGLTAAPSSNNTALVNDAIAADQDWTKHTGENGTEIPIDTAGTEITSLVGKFAAFKIAGTTDEYFTAFVDSATRLTKAKRGYFFDSSNAAVPRAGYTNNDTITLMKLTWVFATTTGTLTATYNPPVWSDDEPSSPGIGDYWFDYSANKWKVYGVGSYSDANAMLIGCCIQDATNTVAARSFEFFKNYDALNTVELIYDSATQVKARHQGSVVNVWGESIKNDHNIHVWDITLDRDSGVSESASTFYYFYITETGDKIISDVRPHDRREDLQGYYHTHKSWRCVGWAFNNGSSNLSDVESHFRLYPADHLRSVIITDIPDSRDETIILSGASFTSYLPSAAFMRGRRITYLHAGTSLSQVYTLDGFAAETVAGAATVALYTNGEVLILISDGTNWLIYDHRATTADTDAGVLVISGSSVNPVKGTTARDVFYWNRKGDQCLFRYEYKQTAAGSGTTGTGDYQIELPSGITIDTTKVLVNTGVFGAANMTAGATMIGHGGGALAGVNSNQQAYVLSSTQFKIWVPGAAVWSAGYGPLNGSTHSVMINGKFPVPGWLP